MDISYDRCVLSVVLSIQAIEAEYSGGKKVLIHATIAWKHGSILLSRGYY